jgi:hypothetical protein
MARKTKQYYMETINSLNARLEKSELISKNAQLNCSVLMDHIKEHVNEKIALKKKNTELKREIKQYRDIRYEAPYREKLDSLRSLLSNVHQSIYEIHRAIEESDV